MVGRTLAAGFLALLLSSCGMRHYRLEVAGRSDLLTPPKRSGEPVSSREAYRRTYGRFVSNGYIDLRDGLHLKVVAPAMPPGSEISTNVVSAVQESESSITLTVESNVTGWETAYYLVERRGNDDTLAFRFLEGESQIKGQRRTLPAPERARVDVPTRFPLFRLVFRQGESEADRSAGLIAASTPQALAQALTHLERSCEGPSAGDFACLSITGGVAINAVVGVSANGRMRYFPLGTPLWRLLSNAQGVPRGTLPPDLKVCRRFRDRLAAVRYDPKAIVQLVLMDGDRVEWSPVADTSTQ